MAAEDCASCAVTAAGELYTWGSGVRGRLGHGDTAGQLAPKRVEALQDERVVAISPASCHTVVVTFTGSVFGWGEAEGLGLPEAAITVHDEHDGTRRIGSPYCFPQLACVLPRS